MGPCPSKLLLSPGGVPFRGWWSPAESVWCHHAQARWRWCHTEGDRWHSAGHVDLLNGHSGTEQLATICRVGPGSQARVHTRVCMQIHLSPGPHTPIRASALGDLHTTLSLAHGHKVLMTERASLWQMCAVLAVYCSQVSPALPRGPHVPSCWAEARLCAALAHPPAAPGRRVLHTADPRFTEMLRNRL